MCWVFFFVILFVCILYVSADMCYSACVESRRPLSAVNSTVVSTLNSGHQIVLPVALIDTITKSHLREERVML